jgi:PD-(D/E)XK nuclease superfamily
MSDPAQVIDTIPAQTPFLSGTNIQYAWDATCLEAFKRCPRLYYYKMIEGWRSKTDNIHLRFGGEFHTALQQYELVKADGLDHDECMFHVVRELLYRVEDWDPDDKYKNRQFLIRSVIGWLDKYKDDNAVVIKQANGKPAVEVSFAFELDYGPIEGQPYVLCGHLDRIVDFQGELFVMDHKTTKTTPSSYYWDQFEPNNQMTLYTLAGKVIFQTNVKGVIIDSAQLMIDTTRFTRGTTYRTQDQLEEWLLDLEDHLDLALKYAKQNYWPMNDTACDKYGGCEFRDVCSKSPSVRSHFLKGDFNQEEPWNPLKVR